jgi:hypothetical protein
MPRYINQRFISTEIVINSAEGLKIPVTSIVEKNFYQVPLSYFRKGGDSDKNGLTRVVTSTDGGNEKTTQEFIATDIYYQDEKYAYVDTNLFGTRDMIIGEDDKDAFILDKTEAFKGVFNVNKGYAVFRHIEILYQNEEYCIVKKNTANGLSVYDHIALDSSTAKEQAIIY